MLFVLFFYLCILYIYCLFIYYTIKQYQYNIVEKNILILLADPKIKFILNFI